MPPPVDSLLGGAFKRCWNCQLHFDTVSVEVRRAVWKMVAWTVIGGVSGFVGVNLALNGLKFFTNFPDIQNLQIGLVYGIFSVVPGAAVGATFGAARIILKELGEIRREMNRHQMLSQTASDVNEPSASIKAGFPPEGRRF